MTVQGRVLCQNRARHKFKQDSRATWCWVRLPSSVMAGLLDTCNLTWPTIWTCHLFFIIFLKKINFFYKIRIALVLILMHLLLLLHIYHSTSEPNTIVGPPSPRANDARPLPPHAGHVVTTHAVITCK